MKRFVSLILVLVLAASVFTACSTPGSVQPASTPAPATAGDQPSKATEVPPAAEKPAKDTLIVAMPDSPIYMDPQVNATTATFRVTTNMFDRLVQLNGNMELTPKLAEKWEVLDDKTTVFHLRQGVKFHNGEEMTSEDVKYSLERAIASPGVQYNYLIIDKIEAVDKYTVKITTKAPFNSLLYRLTLDAASIISKKAGELGPEEFNKHPVGAGPFKFVSWETGGDVVLEAFEDYWAGPPKIKKVILRQIPEAMNRVIGLETGEIDLAYDIAVTDIDAVKGNPALTFVEKPSLATYFLGFNLQKPIMKELKVRQAIAYALNVPDFMSLVFNDIAVPANYTVVTPKLFGHAVPTNVDYSNNLDKAKALLAEAGYPDGFKTTLWCNDTATFRKGAEVVQAQLRKIGIEAEIKSQEMGNFFAATAKGEHDMILFYKLGIDPDSVLRSVYHTKSFGQPGNRFFYSNPDIDAKLDEANSTLDNNRAAELYKEIQEMVAIDLPFIPICNDYINAAMQKNVAGFDLYPGQTHSVYGVYFTD